MRLAVHVQREIARLHFYDPSQSHRAIARALGLSGTTVKVVRAKLRVCMRNWSDLQLLDDDEWTQILDTKDHSVTQRKPAPNMEWIHAEMQRPDATLEQLWHEWREICPDGVAYSQFTHLYRASCKARHIVMRRPHIPGQNLYVDFAGRTVEVKDPDGGPSITAQIFVAVLGYSNWTYVRAVASQTTADWIRCHIDCFSAMGGVPKWVVCDNLKAAVWRRERDKIIINPAYRDCLRHYDSAALPTGVRKPKHKAKAEVGVQIVQRWMLFPLRNRIFFSLEELNTELRMLCDKFNRHPFKTLPDCRQKRFETGEREALKPLPAQPFELCDWRYGVLAEQDYHVEHERRYYSVPFKFAGERVDIRFTTTVLEIFYKGQRVAIHTRLIEPGTVSTIREHMPIIHARILEGEEKALSQWARSTGPGAEKMIHYHLQERTDVTNGLRTARRLRDLARLHGIQRFEEVCTYALALNIKNLRSITSIFEKEPDRRARSSSSPDSNRPVHQNLRGARYFGEQS